MFCSVKTYGVQKVGHPSKSVSGVQHHLKPVIAFFRVAPWLEVAFSLCWYFHYFCAASAKKKPKGLSTVTAANTIQDGTNATAAAGGSKTREASNASSAPAGKTQNAVSAVCKAGGGLRNYIYFPAWWVLFLSSLCFPAAHQVIMEDAVFEPGTPTSKGWCATYEPRISSWHISSPHMSHHIWLSILIC